MIVQVNNPKIATTPPLDGCSLTRAPAIICLVDDHLDFLEPLGELLTQRYTQGNVAQLHQTQESAEEIAYWVLRHGATALVTDNRMQRGTFGVDVIMEVAKQSRDTALRMTFVITTGEEHEARLGLNHLSGTLGAEIFTKITILGKPLKTAELYSHLDARWQPGGVKR